MTSLIQKIDFCQLSDDEEVGSEVSITSVSSGCEADHSKNMSPHRSADSVVEDVRPLSGSSADHEGGEAPLFLQGLPVTSSPHNCMTGPTTPFLVRGSSRLLRHRAMASPIVVNSPSGNSPPYKRIKGLNLGDVPVTPRTLLHHCMLPPSLCEPVVQTAVRSADRSTSRKMARARVETAMAPVLTPEQDRQRANLNPFTPRGRILSGRKRLRDSISSDLTDIPLLSSDCSLDDMDSSVDLMPITGGGVLDSRRRSSACSSTTSSCGSRRVSLAETEVASRLEREFAVQEVVGTGEFGCVMRCINRLDGCTYAVKRSHRPVAGGSHERAALNEVYAHAVLGQHTHIVRYYSAWSERGHMLIQNEFCTRSSLAAVLERRRATDTRCSERQTRRMLLHVARGLRYIHSMRLCHLDLKPENVFLTDSPLVRSLGDSARLKSGRASADIDTALHDETSSDDGFEDDLDAAEDDVIYKIGDFGHVTSLDDPCVEEGDCRYMPREILREDYSVLDRADMFALGLTALECIGGLQLPKNGELWQQLRDGRLPPLSSDVSDQLVTLLRQLLDPQPQRRPDSAQLLANSYLQPLSCRSRAQLRRELCDERRRNRQLRSRLAELGVVEPEGPATPPSPAAALSASVSAPRLVGRGACRSRSTNF